MADQIDPFEKAAMLDAVARQLGFALWGVQELEWTLAECSVAVRPEARGVSEATGGGCSKPLAGDPSERYSGISSRRAFSTQRFLRVFRRSSQGATGSFIARVEKTAELSTRASGAKR